MASILQIEVQPRETFVDAFTYNDLFGAFLSLFREVDASLTQEAGKRGYSLRWLVRSQHSSNPTIELLAESVFDDLDLSAPVIRYSQDSLDRLQQSAVRPLGLTYSALERCQKIGDLLHRDGVTEVIVSSDSRAVQVTEKLDVNVREIMGQKVEVAGSLEGELAMVTLRGRPYFNLYSLSTGRATRCHFNESLRESVREALGRIVVVKGLIRSFPHEEGQEIQDIGEMIIVQEEELPGPDDVLGIYPNLTEGKPSEQYLQESVAWPTGLEFIGKPLLLPPCLMMRWAEVMFVTLSFCPLRRARLSCPRQRSL